MHLSNQATIGMSKRYGTSSQHIPLPFSPLLFSSSAIHVSTNCKSPPTSTLCAIHHPNQDPTVLIRHPNPLLPHPSLLRIPPTLTPQNLPSSPHHIPLQPARPRPRPRPHYGYPTLQPKPSTPNRQLHPRTPRPQCLRPLHPSTGSYPHPLLPPETYTSAREEYDGDNNSCDDDALRDPPSVLSHLACGCTTVAVVLAVIVRGAATGFCPAAGAGAGAGITTTGRLSAAWSGKGRREVAGRVVGREGGGVDYTWDGEECGRGGGGGTRWGR